MAFARVAAVTGANKGIGEQQGAFLSVTLGKGLIFDQGLAIVRNLALEYSSSAFNNGPFLIYLTARDSGRGEEAVKTLHDDARLKKAKAFGDDGGLVTIKYHGLDISKPHSIKAFASFLQEEHPEGIDMVVNNAGIALNGFGTDPVRGLMD